MSKLLTELRPQATDSPAVRGAKNKARGAMKRVFQRQMREAKTPAEAFLWEKLKDKALGVKFTPQAIIHGFLPDFWCGELRLAIEVDGSIHEKQISYDKWREAILKSHHVTIVRFTNDEVFRERDNCVMKIQLVMTQIRGKKSRIRIPKWKLPTTTRRR